jgi:hypothetical protein
MAKLRCAVFEVPISYYGRTYAEGKKIGVLDGVAAGTFCITICCQFEAIVSYGSQLGSAIFGRDGRREIQAYILQLVISTPRMASALLHLVGFRK